MPNLSELEVGVMIWAGRDPVETLREMKSLGVSCGQLAIPGDMPLAGAAEVWNAALEAEDFTLETVFCTYTGESYADIPTVKQTIGFIPPATRTEREARTMAVSDFAADLGVHSIACHIGFVPHDPNDAEYVAVRELVRRVCDHAAAHGQTFALETGQEPADVLLKFLNDVNRNNIGINFDPANMILYGTGDPIQALDVLGPRVISVHCKDGCWPPKDAPNALGVEEPLGQGDVGMDKFLAKLKQIGYKGALHVEREVDDHARKIADLRMGVALIKSLKG